jgi:polyisoprenoid-binding protein YceI
VRFVIDPESSTVSIEARSSVHPVRGQAHGVEGTAELVLDGNRPDLSSAPSARIELPIRRLESGNPLYDSEMQRRVEARTYPTIVGELDEAEATAIAGHYRVHGNLTFHGRTRPVTAEIEARVDGDSRLVADWEQTIDIRDFGVQPPRLLMLRVHPEVRVRVHLEATPERGPG